MDNTAYKDDDSEENDDEDDANDNDDDTWGRPSAQRQGQQRMGSRPSTYNEADQQCRRKVWAE